MLFSMMLFSASFSRVNCSAILSYSGNVTEFKSYISFYSGNELDINTDSASTYAVYIVIWFSEMEQFLLKTSYSIYPSVAIDNYTVISLVIGEKYISGEQINEPYFRDWIIKDIIVNPEINDLFEIVNPKTIFKQKIKIEF
jgi:hypothetical protein